jgi:hypothetical protein
MKDLQILRVNRQMVDVFSGMGWENWSRFEKTEKGIRLVKGTSVSPEHFKIIKHVLSK